MSRGWVVIAALGLAVDDERTLWIADDRAGRLLRFPGALARIAAALGAHSTGP